LKIYNEIEIDDDQERSVIAQCPLQKKKKMKICMTCTYFFRFRTLFIHNQLFFF